MVRDRNSENPAIDPIASLRERKYLTFLLGSLVSNVGNQMRTTAVGWEVYHRTGEPLSLGIVGLVLALPVILLALPAGAAADRWSRRKIIMLAQAGMAASGLGLAWASYSHAPIAWTYLFLLGTGAFRALGWPAATAIVAGLVPAKVFPNAATWRSAGFQLAATLGPLAAGLLLAHYSATTVYLLDAASSVVQILSLLAVGATRALRDAEPHSWRSIADGVRFLRRRPVLLSTMVLDMVAVLFGGATALAHLRGRHSARWAHRLRMAACDGVDRRHHHEHTLGDAAAISPRWTGALDRGRRLRRRHDRVRTLTILRRSRWPRCSRSAPPTRFRSSSAPRFCN